MAFSREEVCLCWSACDPEMRSDEVYGRVRSRISTRGQRIICWRNMGKRKRMSDIAVQVTNAMKEGGFAAELSSGMGRSGLGGVINGGGGVGMHLAGDRGRSKERADRGPSAHGRWDCWST